MKTQSVRHSRSLCLLPSFPPWLLPSWTEVVGDCPRVRLVIGKESFLTRGDAEDSLKADSGWIVTSSLDSP